MNNVNPRTHTHTHTHTHILLGLLYIIKKTSIKLFVDINLSMYKIQLNLKLLFMILYYVIIPKMILTQISAEYIKSLSSYILMRQQREKMTFRFCLLNCDP